MGSFSRPEPGRENDCFPLGLSCINKPGGSTFDTVSDADIPSGSQGFHTTGYVLFQYGFY